MRMYLSVFAAALLLSNPCTGADSAEGGVKKPLVARTLEDFEKEIARIHRELEPGGLYEFTSPTEKDRVEQRLNYILSLLRAHANQEDMTATDKAAMLNAQQEANSILVHNDNNRLVCEHEAPVGSHRPVTTCMTYREFKLREQGGQKYLRDRGASPAFDGKGCAMNPTSTKCH